MTFINNLSVWIITLLATISVGSATIITDSQYSFRKHPQNSSNYQLIPAPSTTNGDIGLYIRQQLNPASTAPASPTKPYHSTQRLLYEQRNWQPIWFNTSAFYPQADSAVRFIGGLHAYGLLPEFYPLDQLQQLISVAYATKNIPEKEQLLAEADICLTAIVLKIMDHLHTGKTRAVTPASVKTEAWLHIEGLSLLNKAITEKEFTKYIALSQPSAQVYQELQQALASFVIHNSLDSTRAVIADLKKDSVACYTKVKQLLIQRDYFSGKDTLSLSSRDLHQALLQFQQDNGLEPDGIPGTKTRVALAKSNWERFCQAAINLERLRNNMIADSTYILINIPAFQLYVYEKQHLIQTHRAIVGKPQTPTHPLSSHITYIALAPQWNVPYSIATKEMLPRIRANKGYLASNNLLLYNQHNRLVNPYEVDWGKISAANFPFKIRQTPGCDNALGNIMFYFSNPYSTYLHDTNNRLAFNHSNRALSHGCMRVENPVELARYLLSKQGLADTISWDEVENCQLQKKRKQIDFPSPFPIHVRYLTCAAHQQKLLFYPDLYHQDAALLLSFLKAE